MAVNKAEMQADVNRKLHWYGVIKAFSEGKLPDNQQIDGALGHALDHWPIPVDKLSPSGKKLIRDCQDVIETLRNMVNRNNKDQIIQNMLYESYAGDYSPEAPNVDFSKREAKSDASKAYESARTLASLFLTNSDVRKLVSDLGVVGRNLFATAAVETATQVAPSREELNSAITAAPADQWQGAQGGTVGQNQTPAQGLNAIPGTQQHSGGQSQHLAGGVQQPGLQQQQHLQQQPGLQQQQHLQQQPGLQQQQQPGLQQQQPALQQQQHLQQQPGLQQQAGLQQPALQQQQGQQPALQQQPGMQQQHMQQSGVQQGLGAGAAAVGAGLAQQGLHHHQQGLQQQGLQQQGLQQQGLQQQGLHQQGLNQQGYNQQGLNQQGVQQHGLHQQGQQYQQGQQSQFAGAGYQRDGRGQDYDRRGDRSRRNRRRYSSSSDDEDDDDADRAARRARESAQRVLDQAFPEEVRRQFIWRLKRVLVNVQGHRDYQDAMSFFLDMANKYGSHAQTVAGHAGQETGRAVDRNTPVSMLLTVLERFANGTSLQGVRHAVDQLYREADNDRELSQWWSDVYQYIRNVLLDEGYVLEDECQREGEALQERGQYFYQQKYRASWDEVWNQLTAWLKEFDNDPLNTRLGEDFRRLTHDLLFDPEGNLKFKPELVHDIKTIIVPTIIKKIGYVPVPRAEYSDDKIDLVVDNLVLSGPNLFPNTFEYDGSHRWKWSPFDGAGDISRHRMSITMSQIQADIRDVRFAFRKKSGFPKMSDHGFADVTLARHGITITVELEASSHKASVFRVRRVTTHVDQLSFNIRAAKHDLLYKFIKGAATRAIKKAIAKAVEKAVTDSLETVDHFLVDVRNTVNDTRGREDVNTKEALAQLFKRKEEEGAAEAQKAHDQARATAQERNSQFAIVTSADKEILPDLNQGQAGKGSMTNQFIAAEKQAGTGQAWHSPAFTVV